MDTRNKIFTVIGTVAILATAGTVGALLFTQQDGVVKSPSTTTSQTSSSTKNNTTPTTTTTGSYKDGTYTASTSYAVPKGDTNTIEVTVTIANGKITAVTTDDSYTDHESGMYIQDFKNKLKGVIVGQSIGSTTYSRIGGASLTSGGFYDALDIIATKAQV